MTEHSEFQEVLDEAVPGMVEAALDYVDGDPRVTDVWILATFEDNVGTHATVYRVAGRILPLANGMPEAFPEFGNPNETIAAIDECLDPVFFDIQHPSQLPNRVIVHYDVRADAVTVEGSTDRIPRQGDEPYNVYTDRWARHFQGGF